MVQFKSSSALLLAALFALKHMGLVSAKPGFTIRDLVNHEILRRDFESDNSLVSRGEIEELFGRHLDTELSRLSNREVEEDLEEVYSRQPEHAANFFRSIGDFVKRCLHGYWQHMIRKSQTIIGKCHDNKDDFDFLPRSNEDASESALTKRSWGGDLLRSYRDASLGFTSSEEEQPAARDVWARDDFDDRVTYWSRELLEDLELDERDWDWDLDELD